MIGKVDHVVLFVSDMKRAAAFYRNVLGFQVVSESPHFTMIKTENIWLGLHPTEMAGQDIGKGPVVYFATPDMDAAKSHLSRNQVQMAYGQDVPGGRIQTFYDSEGNTLGLYSKG